MMNNTKKAGYIIVGLAAIVLIIYFINSTYTVKVCDTEECFIHVANQCRPVKLVVTNEIGTIQYYSKDCVLNKTIMTLNPNETEEMKILMEGKSVVCGYNQKEFNENWMHSLVAGIGACEGDLKEIVGELLLLS